MKLPHLLHIRLDKSIRSKETRTILKNQESFLVSEVEVRDEFEIEKELFQNTDLAIISFEKKNYISARNILSEIISQKFAHPILVCADASADAEAAELLKLGAKDVFFNPVEPDAFLNKIKQHLDKKNPQSDSIQRLKENLGLKSIVGKNELFLAEINKLPVFAKCDACVLINGETGTGKEMIARSIHYLSDRADKPFVPINCGAIPAELVENELFGHEKGAFTGASNSQKGLIREADQGTLFLDEIDSLPLFSQVKLLRFLQDKEFRSLGSSKTRKADVRIIAASNIDLEDLIDSGKLRLDFYYRLNVLQIFLPPLSQRPDDIPLLAGHFLEKYAAEFNKKVFRISDSAIAKLQAYDWQGNVRELENVIERAVLLCETEIIKDTDIQIGGHKREKVQENFQMAKAGVIEKFEKSYLQKVLSTYHGNISQAAKAAGKNRRAFFELIRKYEINVERFRLEK